MRYHNITKADMLNGEGLRVVLWVSGCSHHCPTCHNPITWNENDGLEFDDETINGLKSKYIQVGNRLLGGVEPTDKDYAELEVDNYADELVDLFSNQGSTRRIYPDWYFTQECCSLTKWRLESWMLRNNYTWEQFAKEVGISVEELYWKVTQHKKMSMMDMICLMEIMGAKDLFYVTYFPTKKMRRKVEEKLFKIE